MKTPVRALLAAAFMLIAAQSAVAADRSNPAASLNSQDPTRGWFFYEDPEQEVIPKAEQAKPADPKKRTEKQPNKCLSKATWAPDCGFVDPGTDFEFQAKQRDVLIERMSVSRNDPKAVEDFQRYMRWAMGRATEVANLWHYNTVQNPDLDPSVSRPISQFGVRLMADVKSNHNKDIFQALKDEGAGLVYFTRSDCTFCKSMAPLVKNLGTETGLPVWNAALDDRCESQFADKCRTGKDVSEPAKRLSVTVVPTLFLVLPDDTWIRVGTGVTDTNTLASRIVTFFSAYRNALLKGLQPGADGKPAMDFSDTGAKGTAEGVRLPTESDVNKLLMGR